VAFSPLIHVRTLNPDTGGERPYVTDVLAIIALALCSVIAATCLIIEMAALAHAAPPPGVSSTGPVADWVHSWYDRNGFGCCGLNTDCRPTIVQPTASGGGYEAWIGKEQFGPSAPDDWRPVPTSAWSEGSQRNPTGVSWACWYSGRVLCASLGTGL
jgi:hypothetical protein